MVSKGQLGQRNCHQVGWRWQTLPNIFQQLRSTSKQLKEAMPGVCAFFDMLEVQHQSKWHMISDADQTQDVKLVCSIIASKFYSEVLDLPILDIKYSWSGEFLESLIAFCKWHCFELDGKIAECEPGPWAQYLSDVNRLLVHLESGYTKKLKFSRGQKIIAKNA